MDREILEMLAHLLLNSILIDVLFVGVLLNYIDIYCLKNLLFL